MSGNDVNNAYLSILKSYQQIDQQYSGFTNNALLNSSIFGSTGASSSSSANKTAMWLGIASIAGSALTAGASIWGTIAMNKSMRQAASAAAQQKQAASVDTSVDYTKMELGDLQVKESELSDRIYQLGQDELTANRAKEEALNLKQDAKSAAEKADKEYNEAKAAKPAADQAVTDRQTSKTQLESALPGKRTQLETLRRNQSKANSSEKGSDFSEEIKKLEADIAADEAKISKLGDGENEPESIKAAEKEQKRLADLMQKNNNERVKQNKTYKDQSDKAIAEQKKESDAQKNKLNAERELEKVRTEIANRNKSEKKEQ